MVWKDGRSYSGQRHAGARSYLSSYLIDLLFLLFLFTPLLAQIASLV
jgi:hypothetical protein